MTATAHNNLAFPLLLLGAICIAFAPIFVRLSELGPVATAFYRVLLALPPLYLWMRARQQDNPNDKPATRREFLILALAGLFFALDLAVWHWSIKLTSVANATLFANFAPLFVTLGAWVLFRERCTRGFIVSMLLAIAGAAVLMSNSLKLDGRTLVGDGLGILTAVFYGGYILTVARLRGRFSTATVMYWSALSTALVLLPIAWLSGESMLPPTLQAWAILLALAWLSHAAGQSFIAYALAHLNAAFSSVSLLLQPVVAALLAWYLFAEALGGLQLLGGLAVLTGIAAAKLLSSGKAN